MTLAALNQCSAAVFCEALAGLYECSPWIPQKAAGHRPFRDDAALRETLRTVVDQAPESSRLALLRAHPNLAAKIHRPTQLTRESQSEQNRAGLDTFTAEEADELLELNQKYQEKFGFPFIQCVRAAGRETILPNLRTRLANPRETEISRALQEVHLIAGFRLDDLLGFK